LNSFFLNLFFMFGKSYYFTVTRLNGDNLRKREAHSKFFQDFKDIYFIPPLIKYHGLAISRRLLDNFAVGFHA
jgi:hypothetical protein